MTMSESRPKAFLAKYAEDKLKELRKKAKKKKSNKGKRI